jgi:hypothetical protein
LRRSFAVGGVAESDDVEVFGIGTFGEEGAVEFGLGALEAALLPVGANERVDVELFEGGLGGELAVVLLGDGFVGGGFFAGNDDGSVQALSLCAYREHLVALHGFIRKTRATPDEDLAMARKRKKELEQ